MTPLSEREIRYLTASVADERRTQSRRRHQLALRIFPAAMVGVYVGSLGEYVATSAFVLAGMAWAWFGLGARA